VAINASTTRPGLSRANKAGAAVPIRANRRVLSR
jgi:hypothetical protein